MRIPSTAILAGGLVVLPKILACDRHLHTTRDEREIARRDANLVPRQDTSGVPRPLFGNVPYGTNVDRCTVPGKLAITFDDGPDIFTSDLLDILKKNNAKATFFVVGDNGRFQRKTIGDPTGPYPALLTRMHAEGHQIASHSWSHQNFTTISAQQRREELLKLESVFVSVLGFIPTYFRPPFTSWDDATDQDLKRFGYHNVNFDLDTEDWYENYARSRSLVSTGLSGKTPATSSFITLLHEIHEKSVYEFLQFVIDEANKYHYELVTVGECLGDPPNNWYRDGASGQPWGGPPPAKPKEVTSSSSSSPSSSTSSSPSKSESTKTPSTTSGPTTTTSTTVAPKPTTTTSSTPSPAATTTTATRPNTASRPDTLLSSAVMFFGAAVIFACL